jgi:branched-chain amino acid transport system ATP-binding protein
MSVATGTETTPSGAARKGEVILSVDDLHVYYGNIAAVKGLTFSVREGEIVTLIGSNGAGKSTTLRTISGLIRPRKGQITFRGKQITKADGHEIVASGICHSPEGRRIFPRMTVDENLDLGAFLRKDKVEIAADRDRVLELFPRLAERISQKAGTMSGGEQQMLAISRALMARPKLLLLDEPSMGLAPIMVQKIFEVVRDVAKGGMTILLIEQNARLALQISQRGYVMDGGLITLEGESQSLLSNPKVREAYLGEG